MRDDLIIRYLSSVQNRIRLSSDHLEKYILTKDSDESEIPIEGPSESDQFLSTVKYLTQRIESSLNSLKELCSALEEKDF